MSIGYLYLDAYEYRTVNRSPRTPLAAGPSDTSTLARKSSFLGKELISLKDSCNT